MSGISGKRTLITGGAMGIGAATATRFLDDGAHVLVLDRDKEAGRNIFQSLPNLTGFIEADVSDETDVAQAFNEIDRIFGGELDILINNAGISMPHSFMDISPVDWRRVIDVNLNGVFLVAQEASRRMLKGDGGVIINMGSTNALRGYPHYADYNASKAGVLALTRTMALELAPAVRVVAVCPGYVRTPMQEAEYSPEMMAAIDKNIPLGRQASPEEIAALFAFLASEDAGFITGTEIVIDGGEIIGTIAGKKE